MEKLTRIGNSATIAEFCTNCIYRQPKNPKPRGLVIRYFSGGYYVCDGVPPEGRENDGELYIGNAVKWFESFDEATAMKNVIDAAYGFSH